jgi:UDP-N-acetylmuramyl pentapeptide phosphotransferase/UDP-N-acetylglucosamine-1-phosphate transferase
MLGLVAVMNVVNFSDGVDGLAAGVCSISGVAFTIIAFDLHHSAAAILAAATAGAAAGFLIHNFHPASVIMGDSGANLLGYLLGVIAVEGSLKTNAVVTLITPLVVLAVPFLDTSFVIAKRLKYKRAPWTADANHFHHRMAPSAGPSSTSTPGPCAWRGSGWRCASCPTPTITAICTPAGRRSWARSGCSAPRRASTSSTCSRS